MIFKSLVGFTLFLILQLFLAADIFAQADSLQNEELDPMVLRSLTTSFVRNFDGTRVINGQSVETPYAHDLQFMISHRFGPVSGGIHTLYGLDQSNVRLSFDYGITNRFAIGIGRSSQKETYDGYVKYKVLRQSTGKKNIPFSLTLFVGTGAMGYEKKSLDTNSTFASRLTFVYQAIAAKKIGKFSIQLSPTVVYRNRIESYKDQFYTFALGFSGRYKLSKMFSLTGEYFYVLPGYVADTYYNSASVGIDIQTGGHVFQIHFSNSQGMVEQFYILQTTDDWLKKGMRLGFNMSRTFTLKKNKHKKW